ncbi:MAG TPA: general stress protein [Gemmataceae bacterium]|nr:general stress protein [Gemmataceae bacterium]
MLATRTTVVGVFTNRSAAEQAIAELRQAGFRDEHIGMVAKDERGKVVETRQGTETMAEEGAAAGAIAGAGVGAAVGLAVLTGMIPAIGPAIVAGTLGTILTNAVGGAAIAGIAGALIGWGIPEDEARYYESEVKAGRYLVTVDAGDRVSEAETIIYRHGGYNRTPGAR